MTADHATALREAVNVIMHYQFTHTRDGMHALQTLIDAAENAAYEIDRLRDTLALQQRSYEREIVLEVAEERERCASICDAQGDEWDSDAVQTYKNYAAHCASAIRLPAPQDGDDGVASDDATRPRPLLCAMTVRNACPRGYNGCGFDGVTQACVAAECPKTPNDQATRETPT